MSDPEGEIFVEVDTNATTPPSPSLPSAVSTADHDSPANCLDFDALDSLPRPSSATSLSALNAPPRLSIEKHRRHTRSADLTALARKVDSVSPTLSQTAATPTNISIPRSPSRVFNSEVIAKRRSTETQSDCEHQEDDVFSDSDQHHTPVPADAPLSSASKKFSFKSSPFVMSGRSNGTTRTKLLAKRLFHAAFDIDPSDDMQDSYSCAFQKRILLHGRMYVFTSFVCFATNVFNKELVLKFPMSDIFQIKPKNTAFVVPNAIRITTCDDVRWFFASFMYRDEALLLLTSLTTTVQNAELADGGDDDDDDDELFDHLDGESLSDLDEASNEVLEDPSATGAAEAETEADVEPPHVFAELSTLRKLMESNVTGSVGTVYETCFLSQHMYDKFAAAMNFTAVQVSPWQAAGLYHSRSVTFNAPINIPLGPKEAPMECTQWLHYNVTDDSVIFEVLSSTKNVPYAEYFTMVEQWRVVPAQAKSPTSTVSLHFGLRFIKSTMFQSRIEKQSLSDMQSSGAKFLETMVATMASLKPREHVKPPALTVKPKASQGRPSSQHRPSTPRRQASGSRSLLPSSAAAPPTAATVPLSGAASLPAVSAGPGRAGGWAEWGAAAATVPLLCVLLVVLVALVWSTHSRLGAMDLELAGLRGELRGMRGGSWAHPPPWAVPPCARPAPPSRSPQPPPPAGSAHAASVDHLLHEFSDLVASHGLSEAAAADAAEASRPDNAGERARTACDAGGSSGDRGCSDPTDEPSATGRPNENGATAASGGDADAKFREHLRARAALVKAEMMAIVADLRQLQPPEDPPA